MLGLVSAVYRKKSFAIKEGWAVFWSWGYNYWGQLGDGTTMIGIAL